MRRTILLAAAMGVALLVASSLTLLSGLGGSSSPAKAQAQTNSDSEQQQTPGSSRLLEKAEQEGSVRVIVRLRTDFVPEGRLSRPEVADQRDEIESAQTGLQEDLQGTGYQTLREYETVPFIALNVAPRAFQAIQRSSLATDIVEDRLDESYLDKSASEDLDSTNLAESTPLVQAPTMWANGFTGNGQVIAVLDTGVDSAHPFLAGKVAEEACYTSDRVAGSGDCPNGTATQTGAGSGVHCTYAASGCRHGTHVAGIAAGQGSSFSGVAKGASVMSVQVFSQFTGSNCIGSGEDPCTLSWTSDQIAGLERVYALRTTRTFSSVNMSLGGGRYFSNCDSDTRKAIIDNLRSAGIATVIASGNNGYTDSMGAPACISSAVSVGSTTKSDAISSFSNSASFLSLLAPGSSINSSVPGGGFASLNGTSMAAPHVAGAWALLKHKTPTASVTSLLSSLQSTGLGVTDNGGQTKPRINIADAAGLSIPRPANDDFANTQALTGANTTVTGTNVGATKESGEPDHTGNAGGKSVWYRWTPQASGTATIDTAGSNFDTLLAVYGGAVNSLSEVASNDDADGGVQSKVSFTATAGTTYQIAVDGWNSSLGGEATAGNITLRLASNSTPPPDTTPPDTTITSGPSSRTNDNTPSFSFSGSDIVTSRSNLLFSYRVDNGAWSAYRSSTSATLGGPTGLANGSHTFYVRAKDSAGNTDATPARRSFTVDTIKPRATRVVPAENATGIAPGTNVSAFFSEAMRAGSINANTVKLFKAGTTTAIGATVTYDAANKKAILNPNANLRRGVKYKAVVTTRVRDLAGNQLDQNRSVAGNQPKVWFFRIRN